jgi:hypothetical protein
MKKFLIAILSLVLILTLCACGGNAQVPTEAATEPPTEAERCYHTFTSEITAEATCEEEGEITYTCSLCDLSYTEVLEITDHAYIEASCVDPLFCTYCGNVWGEALGHDYTDATCTMASVCTRCGDQQSAALGHHFEDGVCVNCGHDEA